MLLRRSASMGGMREKAELYRSPPPLTSGFSRRAGLAARPAEEGSELAAALALAAGAEFLAVRGALGADAAGGGRAAGTAAKSGGD